MLAARADCRILAIKFVLDLMDLWLAVRAE
jgi:hypothetical protein